MLWDDSRETKLESGPGDNKERAAEVREAIARLELYPTAALENDVGLERIETNLRATLPSLIGQLSRTDLAAVDNIVKLLVLFPRPDDGVFSLICRLDKRWRSEIESYIEEGLEV